MKKLIKLIAPHFKEILRLLPKAMLYGLPLLFIYVWLVDSYNDVDHIAWGIYLAGFLLSIVGFYISHFTSRGIKNWLAKEENEI